MNQSVRAATGPLRPSAVAANLEHAGSWGLWPAWAVLGISLLLTLGLAWQVKRDAEADALRQMALLCDQLASRFQDRLATQAQMLRSGAAIWANSTQQQQQQQPDWLTLGQQMQWQSGAGGMADIGMIQSAPRARYSPVVFMAPQSHRHAELLGFDMQSDPAASAALALARDTGRTIVSAPVALPGSWSGTGQADVLLLVVPVYAGHLVTDTPVRRRAALLGWVYAPVRLADVLARIVQDWQALPGPGDWRHLAAGLQATISNHSDHPDHPDQSDRYQPARSQPATALHQQRVVTSNGQSWLLALDSPSAANNLNYTQVWLSLGAGLVLGLLLFALLLSVIQTRGRASQMARRLTRKIREADAALRHSEARLRSTLDTLPYLLVELDLQGVYHDLHGPEVALTGPNSTILEGQSVRDVLPPAAAQTYLDALQQAHVAGKAYGYQLSLDTADGPRWYELSVSRKLAALGAEPRFIVLSRDITEQRNNQMTLQRALTLQETMLDASVHAIFATTPQGIVTHFNRSAETMLGYLAADMIGQPSVLRMFAPASLAERAAEHHLPEGQHGAVGFAGLVAMALDTTVRPFDDVRHWQALRHDGLEFPAQVLAVALHDADTAAVSGFLFVIIDLTDDLRSRAELQRAKQEAERANNAKTRFLAAASHDLRQPLAALSLYLGLLRSRLASADAPLMHSVDDCVSSLTELLDDLLDVSKLEAGVVSTELSDFSVDELLQRQVSVHSASAEQKGLRLRLHRTGFMAHTDQVLLARMVGNLIANAIRYTEQGGILLGCRRHLGRWWVEVRDTGIGIPQDQIGLIFEEFRQLGHGARNHGSGLGLAIVAKTAALLGLQVRVRSTPGRGSLFAIELPVGRVMERALLALPEPRTSGALCVALVDDNPQILRALGLLLQSAGHQVVAAARQDELMAKLGSQAPDLVITDYRLAAGSTGFEVVDQLRQRFDAALPALLITGDTDPALIRSMSQRGITIQYKPLKPDELLQFVSQVAQRRSLCHGES